MPTYRKFISPLAVALAIMVPGAALAQGAAGSWAQNGDPRSCSPRSSGHLVVTHTAIEQGNSKCRFGGTAPSGFGAVRGNMQCNDGVASIDISAVGNQLTILKNGNPTGYQRCMGAATEPVFDRGPNRQERRDERRAQRRQDEQRQVYREQGQGQLRRDAQGRVYREAQPAPMTQEEAATQMIIDLLGGALSNGK